MKLEMKLMEKCFILFSILRRLTLGIGNFKSSHSLSAGHVPLGLGRDKVGIRAIGFIFQRYKYVVFVFFLKTTAA